jgi:hypothetical protein
MSAMVAARVAGTMAVAQHRRNLGIGIAGRRAVILAAGIDDITRATMAARHRAKQGQALIIGVRRLNFFALVNSSRNGFRTSGGCDQSGGENTVQDKSQGFIL